MTTYKFGEVLLLPFPFTNQTTTKKRPTIVISSLEYHQTKPDLIVIAVTSQIREPLAFGEMKIEKWLDAGLIKPSVIKPIITTIEKNLIIKSLGNLQLSDLQTLQILLKQIILTE
ncbi:MAG: type II toxin-antitoxin system PemK/MazF family toxin [Snowella sp.]|nr:type II toxin-antitoxin system PemK/MazF family toxin [Snowella sp.]